MYYFEETYKIFESVSSMFSSFLLNRLSPPTRITGSVPKQAGVVLCCEESVSTEMKREEQVANMARGTGRQAA